MIPEFQIILYNLNYYNLKFEDFFTILFSAEINLKTCKKTNYIIFYKKACAAKWAVPHINFQVFWGLILNINVCMIPEFQIIFWNLNYYNLKIWRFLTILFSAGINLKTCKKINYLIPYKISLRCKVGGTTYTFSSFLRSYTQYKCLYDTWI